MLTDQVNCGDADNSEEKRAGEVAFGVAHFAGHEAGGLPAAVGE